MLNTKVCKKCGDEQELSEYNVTFNVLKDGTIVTNRRSDCKTCQQKYRKLYYSIYKDEEMESQRQRRAINSLHAGKRRTHGRKE